MELDAVGSDFRQVDCAELGEIHAEGQDWNAGIRGENLMIQEKPVTCPHCGGEAINRYNTVRQQNGYLYCVEESRVRGRRIRNVVRRLWIQEASVSVGGMMSEINDEGKTCAPVKRTFEHRRVGTRTRGLSNTAISYARDVLLSNGWA